VRSPSTSGRKALCAILPANVPIAGQPGHLLFEIGRLDLTYLRRVSRLQGPEPSCVIRSAPPRIERFFVKLTICIWNIMGSLTPQNLGIIG
jgi:hypothetical protein